LEPAQNSRGSHRLGWFVCLEGPDAKERLPPPTQTPNDRARCFCGAEILCVDRVPILCSVPESYRPDRTATTCANWLVNCCDLQAGPTSQCPHDPPHPPLRVKSRFKYRSREASPVRPRAGRRTLRPPNSKAPQGRAADGEAGHECGRQLRRPERPNDSHEADRD
jgi:hypothetical protein